MSARYFETLRMIEDIATTLGSQNKLTHKGPIYHVKVDPNQDTWKITCLGSEEHTSELQSRLHLVCRLLLEKKKIKKHLQNK